MADVSGILQWPTARRYWNTGEKEGYPGGGKDGEPVAHGADEPLRVSDQLSDIQAGILSDFGRKNLRMLLLREKPLAPNDPRVRWIAARESLGTLADLVTTGLDHRNSDSSSNEVVSVLLSASGYDYLRVRIDYRPLDFAFRRGMSSRRALLADKPSVSWEEKLQPSLAGVVMVWADEDGQLAKSTDEVTKRMEGNGWSVSVQSGARRRVEIEGKTFNTEPFGFVDGLNVLRFVEPTAAAGMETGGPGGGFTVNDSNENLGLVLVRNTSSFGSYVVFRKLRQDVERFKRLLAEVGDTIGEVRSSPPVTVEDAELFVMGRRRNGKDVDDRRKAVPTFKEDPNGERCPFFAHVRVMNAKEEGDKTEPPRRQIVRRGVPYEEEGKEGLLFLAYMASIREQYEVLQSEWANAGGRESWDRDLIVGQGRRSDVWRWRRPGMPEELPVELDPSGLVDLEGGEYLFAPPKRFLMALKSGAIDARTWPSGDGETFGWSLTDESIFFDPIREATYGEDRKVVRQLPLRPR
jgi:Dyp-type peroxidase family